MSWDLACAFVVDLLVGDPEYRWHPVKVIGRAVRFYEERVRQLFGNPRTAGIFLGLSLPFDCFLTVFLLVFLTGRIHGLLGFLVSSFFIYSALSVKDMGDHAGAVYGALKEGNLERAREAVSKIVARDSALMQEREIARATVESVAESTVDGVVSVLFYAALGGAPLAWAFKAVSTLDSMVGYRNERYEEVGAFSARLDDWANYLPARLSRFLIPLAAFLSGLDFRKSLAISLRDGRKHPSRNSGISEAAYAGALGVRLGGVSDYEGRRVEKPYLGDPTQELNLEHIPSAIRLFYWSSFVSFVFLMLAGFVTSIVLQRVFF